jgi:hypothetical protein
VSGAGKTSTAAILASMNPGRTAVFSADDYFTDKETGEYNFDVSKIGNAHSECFYNFTSAIENPQISLIIIANTNTTQREFRHYLREAELHGVRAIVMVIENYHGGGTNHAPEEVTLRHFARLSSSIQLCDPKFLSSSRTDSPKKKAESKILFEKEKQKRKNKILELQTETRPVVRAVFDTCQTKGCGADTCEFWTGNGWSGPLSRKLPLPSVEEYRCDKCGSQVSINEIQEK